MKPPLRRSSEISPFPYPVLIADIGGTNVRFAILSQPYAPLREFPTIRTSAFPDFAAAASATVLDATAIMPRSLLMALAGPPDPVSMKLTNADWQLDPAALQDALNLDTIVTFNDFEALALSLPHLGEGDLRQIGGGTAVPREPRVAVGPGTGLGVAALLYADKRYTPLGGEGGHVSLGPETPRDYAIFPHIERPCGRVSAETILCGRGLMRVYNAILKADGREDAPATRGADVGERFASGDPVAIEALELFFTYLGRVAGDMALIFLAKGGVYIAGGICPRYAEALEASAFRAAFEAKAPHEGLLSQIPTYLITERKPAVRGLAALAQIPERFAFDLTKRRLDVSRG